MQLTQYGTHTAPDTEPSHNSRKVKGQHPQAITARACVPCTAGSLCGWTSWQEHARLQHRVLWRDVAAKACAPSVQGRVAGPGCKSMLCSRESISIAAPLHSHPHAPLPLTTHSTRKHTLTCNLTLATHHTHMQPHARNTPHTRNLTLATHHTHATSHSRRTTHMHTPAIP